MRRSLFALATFFVLITLACGVLAVTVNPDIEFLAGNATYRANHTMEFTEITIDSSYIAFNGTGFYVTSSNPINITLFRTHGNVTGAADGEKILEFNATVSAGNVVFDLQGFPYTTNYTVNMSGSFLTNVTANTSDFITFNNSVWSNEKFEVFQYGDVATTTTSTTSTTVTTTTTTTLGSSGGGRSATTTTTTTLEQDKDYDEPEKTPEEQENEVQEGESEKLLPKIIPVPEGRLSPEMEKQVIVSFLVFMILVGSVAYWKRRQLFKFSLGKPVFIGDILSGPDKFAGKKVSIDGEIMSSRFLKEYGKNLYVIRDQTGVINGLSKKTGYKGDGIVEGKVRKDRKGLYIEF